MLHFFLTYIYIIFYRIFSEAMIKSVLIKSYPTKNFKYPTLREMHASQFTKYQKYPIVGVNRNVGSTTFYDQKKSVNQQYSFGVIHYFCRFNFTSAIYEKPYAEVGWIKFRAEEIYRTCFKGHITGDEFYNAPRKDKNINPFIQLDDLIPSRFAMVFDKPNAVGFDIAFLSMDPERMGETTNDGLFQDIGDNVLSYKSKIISDELSENIVRFLKSDKYI